MEPWVKLLPQLLEKQGGAVAPLDQQINLAAGLLEWSHRDPFDRLLAATAAQMKLPLVSCDEIFDEKVKRIW